VTTGDRIWSDSNGRADIQIGDASIRLWHQTEVDIVRLDDHSVQMAVSQGSSALRVSGLRTGDVAEIDAPNAAIAAESTGEYRVDVSADGLTTTVKVWSGSAEVTSAGSSFALGPHQVATVHGDSAASPTYDVSETTGTDNFDQWATERDERANAAVADRRYVPGDMPGSEDLNEYGAWDYDNDAGPVWYPTQVEVGWVPYQAGHWVWVWPWGWSWVDDTPWGWAPFHYGRWAWFHDRWGWCPGRVIAPAVYAPALVVFVGGPSWSVAANFGAGGGMGWFPLGPGEVYRPPYGVSTPYIRRLNVTTVTNVTNIMNVTNITYVNRGVPNAMTAVPRNVFESGAAVGHAAVRVTADEMQRAPLMGSVSTVVPTRASVSAGLGVRPGIGRPVVQARSVVALHAPPPVPAPLAAQLRIAVANAGRPPIPQQLGLSTAGAASGVRVLSVRSAARPALNGVSLTPARPGLPTTRPAIENGSVARVITVPPARVVGPSPATAVRVPSNLGPPPPVPHPAIPTASPSLEASYDAQRQQQETRHIQEFAKPPAGETQAALAARQEAEDQALESSYHQAASAGRVTMPPPRPSTSTPSASHGRK